MNTIACKDSNGRPVIVTPITVHPGESVNCTLPHHGRRATDYLAAVLSGEVEYLSDVNVNHTDTDIVVYRGVWADSNLPTGFF